LPKILLEESDLVNRHTMSWNRFRRLHTKNLFTRKVADFDEGLLLTFLPAQKPQLKDLVNG
jgi:hypothetical protein